MIDLIKPTRVPRRHCKREEKSIIAGLSSRRVWYTAANGSSIGLRYVQIARKKEFPLWASMLTWPRSSNVDECHPSCSRWWVFGSWLTQPHRPPHLKISKNLLILHLFERINLWCILYKIWHWIITDLPGFDRLVICLKNLAQRSVSGHPDPNSLMTSSAHSLR